MNDTAQTPPPPPPSTPQQPPPPPPPSDGGGSLPKPPDSDAMTAMWAHLIGAVLSFICLTALICWAPALVIFLVFKDKSRFVAFHSMQALFFFGAIAMANLALWAFGLAGLVLLTTPLSLVINVGGAIYALIVGLKAKDGKWEEYLVVGELARKQLS